MGYAHDIIPPPFRIDEGLWGEVRKVTLECPGIYYLATSSDEQLFCREFYVVTNEAFANGVSLDVLSYGVQDGQVRLYEFEQEKSGWSIIQFEITRYLTKHGPLPEDKDSLYIEALYASERYPEYFGGILPPRCTPHGLTTRVKHIAEGVFFLDTTHCQWLLAVASPIWKCDFSELVINFGERCTADRTMGEPEAEYLFFPRNKCAPAIYELLDYEEYHGLYQYITSREVLETHIYKQFLMYAVWVNYNEMTGMGRSDSFSNLLSSLGCPLEDHSVEEDEVVLERHQKDCIHFWPELAREELLRLPG